MADKMSRLEKARLWLISNEYAEIGTFENQHGEKFLIYSESPRHYRMFITGDVFEWEHGYEYIREYDRIVKVFEASRDEIIQTGRTIAGYWRRRSEIKQKREQNNPQYTPVFAEKIKEKRHGRAY